MISLDSDFKMKKIFRDAVKILIYRRKPDPLTKNLQDFLSDFYQVILTSSLPGINEEFDLANVLEEEQNDLKGLSIKTFWIESFQNRIEGEIFYGNMKETYRRLFMDQCSA